MSQAADPASQGKVPIIFSADLLHPPEDPDDTYDLATLFALDEFDIRAVILDNALAQQKWRLGGPPVEQMIEITSKHVKWAAGLCDPLAGLTDTGERQPEKRFEAGVELILSCLRESADKVTLLSTGSCRDFAAVYNREPELFNEKVKAVYCVVGSGGEGEVAQSDWNVRLDRWAYFRMFELPVPFYWCGTRPIMAGRNPGGPYSTSYWVRQDQLLAACARPVQNFFVYCLTEPEADPLEFLSSGPHALPGGRRQMWCTGPLCHAAGRAIYRRGPDDFVALTPDDAATAGLADCRVDVFDFVPLTAEPTDVPFTLTMQHNPTDTKPNALAFHRVSAADEYQRVMESVLTNLLPTLGRGR